MITQEIYSHVLSAVRLLIQDKNFSADLADLDALVHGALWTYVTHAVREIHPSDPSAEAAAPRRDGRSKQWQYVVRFWAMTANGPEMIAESDVEVMQGTGSLPGIVETYGAEMHPDDTTFPSALTQSAIKERLPQLRNNLGRQGSAVLRVEYRIDDDAYLCQVDVAKPGA